MKKDRFKFRAWRTSHIDGIESRYFYDVEELYDGSIDGLGWMSCFSDVLSDNEFTIEQCTGLKDKNGNLIYEGDILKVPAFPTGFCDMQVFWNDDNCQWDLKYTGKRSIEKDLTTLVKELGNASEVIGNIHENKLTEN